MAELESGGENPPNVESLRMYQMLAPAMDALTGYADAIDEYLLALCQRYNWNNSAGLRYLVEFCGRYDGNNQKLDLIIESHNILSHVTRSQSELLKVRIDRFAQVYGNEHDFTDVMYELGWYDINQDIMDILLDLRAWEDEEPHDRIAVREIVHDLATLHFSGGRSSFNPLDYCWLVQMMAMWWSE